MYQDYWNGVAQRPAQSTMRRVPQRRPQMAGGMLGGHAYGDDGLNPPRPGLAGTPIKITPRPKPGGWSQFGNTQGNGMGFTPAVGYGGQDGWSGIARPVSPQTNATGFPGWQAIQQQSLPPGAIRLPDGRIGYAKPASQVPTNANIQQMLTGIASGGGDINSLLQALLFQQVAPQQMGNRGVASGSWGGY